MVWFKKLFVECHTLFEIVLKSLNWKHSIWLERKLLNLCHTMGFRSLTFDIRAQLLDSGRRGSSAQYTKAAYKGKQQALSLLLSLLIHFKLVYGPFGQNNIHNILDFCPRPARKEMNVHKVHIFWEGHKILQNLPLAFDCINCDFLIIYEL